MLQCEVIGNIGSDAEIKQFNGKEFVSFNVAHSERRKDSNGNNVEQTTWVSVLWSGNGGGLLQYLKKGCKVFVRGRLFVKTYQSKSGGWLAAVNVSANEVNLCGNKGETTAPQAQSRQAVSQQPQGESAAQGSDDLPF